jgi:hypothetical protein
VLKSLVDEKNVNIQSMSDNIGISRPKFYRFLDGSSLPTQDEYKKICRELYLTEPEHYRIAKAYKISSLGINVYEIYTLVESIIREINQPMAYIPPMPAFTTTTGSLPSVLKGKAAVGAAIDAMFADAKEEEMKSLLILVQPDNELLMENILRCTLSTDCTLQMLQGIRLSAGMYKVNNIEYYHKIIPILTRCNPRSSYKIRFHYVNETASGKLMEMYPNVLLDKNKALLIASDFSSGVVITEREQVDTIWEEALRLFGNMKDMSDQKLNVSETVSFFAEVENSDFSAAYYLEPQPNLLWINPRRYEDLMDNLAHVCLPLAQRNAELLSALKYTEVHQFITMQGLESLLKDETHICLPAELNETFKKCKMAIGLLEDILEVHKNYKNFHIHLLREENLVCMKENSLMCAIFKNDSVIIAPYPSFREIKEEASLVKITEKGVVDAFAGFVANMLEEDPLPNEKTKAYSEEETIVLIKEILQKYKSVNNTGEQ